MGLNTTHPRPELLEFVAGGLEPTRRERVAEHLAACDACRAEAAELARVHDLLGALPLALRPLTLRSASAWPQVWGRVTQAPLRRVVPQLNFYLSLAAVLFAITAALPASLGAQPLPVTAGVIQTPVAAALTPVATFGSTLVAAGLTDGTALAARPATAARPIPIQTPIPGQKG
jgi:anti-sigma factor RsiW